MTGVFTCGCYEICSKMFAMLLISIILDTAVFVTLFYQNTRYVSQLFCIPFLLPYAIIGYSSVKLLFYTGTCRLCICISLKNDITSFTIAIKHNTCLCINDCILYLKINNLSNKRYVSQACCISFFLFHEIIGIPSSSFMNIHALV